MSYTEIGLFVGIVSGAASASGILGGWLADRFSARSIYLVCWMLQVPLLFVITSMTGVSLLVVALLVLSCNLSFVAAENMLVAQYTPVRWRSLAYGAKFVLALGVSGVTVMLAGWVFDTRGNFELLYTGLGAAAIIAAVAATLLPGRRNANRSDTRSAGADRRSESATGSVARIRHRFTAAGALRPRATTRPSRASSAVPRRRCRGHRATAFARQTGVLIVLPSPTPSLPARERRGRFHVEDGRSRHLARGRDEVVGKRSGVVLHVHGDVVELHPQRLGDDLGEDRAVSLTLWNRSDGVR